MQNIQNRWSQEYLLSLRERLDQKQHGQRTWPSVGDVVIIHDEGPRCRWKMGRVTQLLMGKDETGRVQVPQ